MSNPLEETEKLAEEIEQMINKIVADSPIIVQRVTMDPDHITIRFFNSETSATVEYERARSLPFRSNFGR